MVYVNEKNFQYVQKNYFLSMEQDKYISLDDCYVEFKGNENQLTQFTNDTLHKKK